MWFWRRLLRVSWIERISNEIILERMNSSREIMKQIRQKQLRFLGHILRKQKLERRILSETAVRRRSKGRPRTTYMNGLVKTLVEDILNCTNDREVWHFMVANVQD